MSQWKPSIQLIYDLKRKWRVAVGGMAQTVESLSNSTKPWIQTLLFSGI
jgi:hypothetical protein